MNLAISLPTQRIHRIAVSVFFFIAGITFASWASRIPDIKNTLHLSEAGLGTVLLALPAGLMASLPLSGWLVSKYGSRKMILAGAILYPATLVLLGLSTTIWQLVGVLFLFGLWGNLINIAMNTQAVGVENLYGRSIMASFHGLWSLAAFTGALVGSILISANISPFIHFLLICISTVGLVVVFYKRTLPEDGADEGSANFALPDKHILLLGLIGFCSMFCEGAMADWSGVYFQNVVEAPKALMTLGYVAFTGSMATGRFLGDWLVMKIGMKKMLQWSGTLISTGLCIGIFFPHIFPATLGFLLVGFGVSSVVPLVYSLAGKSTTMAPGLALAAVSSVSFLGFLLGPPIIGFIAELTNLQWSFGFVAVLGLGTVLLSGKAKVV
ncbi:MAG: MFS transporter [Gemmatimonadaceae bacterium]|nr:MFS transporter [Chitinophagaceae bacterium]